MRRPPREAWPLARVLNALLMKMGRTACWLSHAVGRMQASLGTPVPRTPTIAPRPKVRSGLASRRSQGSSSEHRGPPKPAASVDAWRLIGRGRLCCPHAALATARFDESLRHARKTIITCDRGRRRLAFSCYKWGAGGAPISHLFLACLLLPPRSTASCNGAYQKVLR